jgi:signal transduction histidine kinase
MKDGVFGMEETRKNVHVFCLYEKKSEVEFFLKSTLSQTDIQRFLLVLSNNKARYSELSAHLKNGFFIKNLTIPNKISSKWKKVVFPPILEDIFNKYPKKSGRQNIFIDVTSIKVTKSFVEFIESKVVEKLLKLGERYSLFFLFLERKLGVKLGNQLVMRFPFICLKDTQIHPNFFYTPISSSKFPTNIRDLYQPIQVLIEKLERNTLEQERLNKELFIANTHNNVLEASLSSMLTIEKKETDTQRQETPADILSLLKYKDLQQRYDQKSLMLSTVTHDIKSPLAAIQGFAEILRDGLAGEVTPEMKNHLQVIVSNSKRLARMVESLLEYESYDRSDYVTQRETFNLIELIQDAKMSILPQMIQKGQKVEIFTPEHLEIVGNRELLLRVLQNTLDNALKYSPQEKGKVELFVEEKSVKGHKIVQIVIKDNGFGFEKKNLKKAFDPFTRFEPGSTSTGLGLSTSKKIIEDLHGGTMEIDSPGRQKGTTVTITLPKS